MNTARWTAISAMCGVAGGASWLAKVLVIVAKQGQGGVDEPLFGAGLGLLLVATTGVGLALSRGRPVWARVVAVVLSPVVALGLFVLVQIVTEPLDGLVPEYVQAEYGIVLAAVIGIVAGVWRLVRPAGRVVRASFGPARHGAAFSDVRADRPPCRPGEWWSSRTVVDEREERLIASL